MSAVDLLPGAIFGAFTVGVAASAREWERLSAGPPVVIAWLVTETVVTTFLGFFLLLLIYGMYAQFGECNDGATGTPSPQDLEALWK